MKTQAPGEATPGSTGQRGRGGRLFVAVKKNEAQLGEQTTTLKSAYGSTDEAHKEEREKLRYNSRVLLSIVQ